MASAGKVLASGFLWQKRVTDNGLSPTGSVGQLRDAIKETGLGNQLCQCIQAGVPWTSENVIHMARGTTNFIMMTQECGYQRVWLMTSWQWYWILNQFSFNTLSEGQSHWKVVQRNHQYPKVCTYNIHVVKHILILVGKISLWHA